MQSVNVPWIANCPLLGIKGGSHTSHPAKRDQLGQEAKAFYIAPT